MTPGKPLMLKTVPASLPQRPASVPEPEQVRLAIVVPSANPEPAQDDMVAEIRPPFVLKIVWPAFSIEFRQDGNRMQPVFRGPTVLDMGGFPRPDGWTNAQATAASRWAVACWRHLHELAAAQAAQWVSLYAQVAGVAVWNVIEALVEDDQKPAA